MPLDEALPIARQIAEALEAAHEQGIIHRDLKPLNIKVRDDGTVKVLDFGLAKALQPELSDFDAANSPTITAAATRAGVIMGTAPYMSPEQAKAKQIDKRTDIWAFGCVFYEILTGQRAFAGETVAEQLAAVLGGTPDWDAIPDSTPFLIKRLVRRCLERDRRERIPDSATARIEIADALKTPTPTTESADVGTVAPVHGWLPWSVAGVVAGVVAAIAAIAVTLVLLWPGATEESRPVTRFDIRPPNTPGQVFLSPDGMRLLYRAPTADGRRPVIRRLDELETRPIPGVEGGNPKSFSPDGEWVVYKVGAEFMKVPVIGGTPVAITETPVSAHGGSWGADGNIYFGGQGTGLWRVSADGGEPEALTTPDAARGELDYHFPRLLPGGESLIFTLHDRDRRFHIETLSLTSGARKVLIEDAFDARYVPTGHLVYGRRNAVLAAPFDVAALEVTGPSVRLVQGVANSVMSGVGRFSVSTDGTLAFIPEPLRGGRKLVWVSRDGTIEPLPIDAAEFGEVPSLSPEGDRVAVPVGADDRSDIWIYDLRDGTQQRVTFEGWNRFPVWTPDGARVAFSSDRAGKENIYWTSVDAGGAAELLLDSGFWTWPTTWAPDGDTLTFTQETATQARHIGMLRVSGPGSAESLIGGTSAESGSRSLDAHLSRDGRFIAYESNEDGPVAVYVRPFPDVNAAQWQISASGGGGFPLWGRDGRELFYRQGRSVMVVPVTTTPTFDTGAPTLLFELAPELGYLAGVSPDGRFLAWSRSEEELAPQPIRVVRNWFQELLERVPVP